MTKNNIKTISPVIVNPNVYNGCGLCAEICQSKVFQIKQIKDIEIKELSFFGKLKVKIKGNIKSHVVKPEACNSCGMCAYNCHEHAIL